MPIHRSTTTMARQTTTTRISTFLVRSLIHDFPKRALARAVIPVAGPSKSPSKPLLPEHRIQVLLLHANDLVFRAKKSPKDLPMVPLTRKGVVERDGMCSIRAGGDSSSAQWWVDRTTITADRRPIARHSIDHRPRRRTGGAVSNPLTDWVDHRPR